MKPAAVTEAMFGDAPLLRSVLFLASPSLPGVDIPYLAWGYGTESVLDRGGFDYLKQSERIDKVNPLLAVTTDDETRI